MDLTWIIFFVIIITAGLWSKWQNTKNIRKMHKEYANDYTCVDGYPRRPKK